MDSKILGIAGFVCDTAAEVTAAMLRDLHTFLPLPEAQYFYGREFLRSLCFREVMRWSLVVTNILGQRICPISKSQAVLTA